jgi:hypothetical protein
VVAKRLNSSIWQASHQSPGKVFATKDDSEFWFSVRHVGRFRVLVFSQPLYSESFLAGTSCTGSSFQQTWHDHGSGFSGKRSSFGFQLGICNYVELIDTIFTDVELIDTIFTDVEGVD